MVLSYEIKEYLIPLVAMDAMVVAMIELQRISMIQLALNHSTLDTYRNQFESDLKSKSKDQQRKLI